MSRTHDVAWASGFFDGEGYVTIQKRNSKAKSGVYYGGYYLRIGVNHVAPEPLYEMQRLFGGKVTKQGNHTVVGNRKPRHIWHISCNKAQEALITMMPYFRNKQKAAELGLELQRTMSDAKYKISDDLHLYRGLLKDALQNLNKMD